MPDFRMSAARDLPVREGTYDRGAAHIRMLDAASIGGDNPDYARAIRGFLIYDASAPELRGSYHLPFADIVDGTLTAIGNGVRNAASRLPQMNGVGPELEAQAKAVIAAYLDRLNGGKAGAAETRAYSLLTVKSISEDQRVFRGIATTPSTDRTGEVVDPLGVQFRNPMPLLHQHDSHLPVGTVSFDRPTKDGIGFEARIPKIAEPGPLKDRVDTAWGEIKAGLVRAVSIGFRVLDGGVEMMKSGLRYTKTEVLELSLVTIPANADATITTIRSLDQRQRAAPGHSGSSIQIIIPPGVSGSRNSPARRELKTMTTVSERIAALEQLRGTKAARFDEVLQKSLAANRTLDDAEQKECSELKTEMEALDSNLEMLRFQEKSIAVTAQPVQSNATVGQFRSAVANPPIRYFPQAKEAKPEPGLRLARFVRCKALARMEQADAARIAEREYGTRDPVLVEFIKAGEVAAISVGAGGDGFLPAEIGFGDFAEYLRPMTILGKFGTGNIPALRRVPFRSGLVSMDTGSSGYWVGEAKPKPVTLVDSSRTHLTPLKVAAIIVLTMELVRDSSPSAEQAIRQDMTDAIVATLDMTFIDPATAASAGVSPASITNGQAAIVSSGTDADAIRLDIRSLFAKFTAVNNPASQAVLVMSTSNARALAFAVNALGQPEFPGMTVNGGTLLGVPVIASDHAGSTVALISAGDVYYADEGGVAIDMSMEASVEMKSSGNLTQHADGTATGAAMVSLWQGNLVGFRAERTSNWAPRRSVVAPYLTSVAWGEAVHAS